MKHITMKKVRYLSLALALIFCLGLFAGCSSSSSDVSDDPSETVSQDVSDDTSGDADDTVSDTVNDTADDSTGGTDDTTGGDTSGVNDVVGEVTAIDGNVVTITIYTTDSGAAIESYANVDMSQYTATEDTDEVDLTDAMIGLAENGSLTQVEVSQIAVGDMLLLSYDSEDGQLLQAVIYAQSES